MQDSSILD
jgi:hypothetical protein